jgi:glycosyltransferase involved in cell wall biosynthesis
VLAGEGPARARLERLVNEQGLTSRVNFLGNQTREAVLSLLRGSSFFVLGSRAEGLPLVILEAMVCGTAVIATNVDGVGEVVEDGVTGLLVEPENPRALADAMLKLHADPTLRRRLADNALARVSHDFSWKTIGGQYLSLFDRVVHRPRADTTA